jgi:hypothetical protein
MAKNVANNGINVDIKTMTADGSFENKLNANSGSRPVFKSARKAPTAKLSKNQISI